MAPIDPYTAGPRPTGYTVVARRYRPQQFAELIGQEHVATALVNALRSGRVAHAYLFTGARGVGKTSTARILAKALNCVQGPTPTPCDRCDSCLAVAAGEDVDVIEIDGASNNRVDEARDIRQNVGFRPTRSRYKIYIIDEVHMLSTGAFNALLKTLEEPPEHVKFILATTEVQKIPITILSRCQRFDFAPIGPAKIYEQLRAVVTREGREADDAALRLIARKANGSMRDSQSLLDQLLAATPGRLTVDHVHAVLGTSDDERVTRLAAAILDRDARTALNLLGQWAEQGLQAGELIDQMIDYWRALMLVSCAGTDVCDPDLSPSRRDAIREQAGRTTLDTILAGLDIWTATRGRLRDTTHAQVLLEMAVVRLCRLEDLLAVGQLVQALHPASPTSLPAPSSARAELSPSPPPVRATTVVRTPPPAPASSPAPSRPSEEKKTLPLTPDTVKEVWREALRHIEQKSLLLANQLKQAHSCAISGPNSLEIHFAAQYSWICQACSEDHNSRRIEEALAQVTGQPVRARCVTTTGTHNNGATPSVSTGEPASADDRKRQILSLPLFRRATEALGARIWHWDEDFDPQARTPHTDCHLPPDPDPDEL